MAENPYVSAASGAASAASSNFGAAGGRGTARGSGLRRRVPGMGCVPLLRATDRDLSPGG